MFKPLDIKHADCVEVLMPDDCWETAICVEVGNGFFKVLCLDGKIRQLNWADKDTKWR